MNSLPRTTPACRSRERGMAIVLLLVLLAFLSVLAVGRSWTLARLRQEVVSIEQRQALRLGNTNAAVLAKPASIPAPQGEPR